MCFVQKGIWNICPSVRSGNRKKVVYHIRSIHYRCLRCQQHCLFDRDMILDHVQCVRHLLWGSLIVPFNLLTDFLSPICCSPVIFLCLRFHDYEDKKLRFSTHKQWLFILTGRQGGGERFHEKWKVTSLNFTISI